MENKKIWYAVLKDADDNDWGTGSEDRAAALEMAEEIGEDFREYLKEIAKTL